LWSGVAGHKNPCSLQHSRMNISSAAPDYVRLNRSVGHADDFVAYTITRHEANKNALDQELDRAAQESKERRHLEALPSVERVSRAIYDKFITKMETQELSDKIFDGTKWTRTDKCVYRVRHMCLFEKSCRLYTKDIELKVASILREDHDVVATVTIEGLFNEEQRMIIFGLSALLSFVVTVTLACSMRQSIDPEDGFGVFLVVAVFFYLGAMMAGVMMCLSAVGWYLDTRVLLVNISIPK